MEVTIGRIVHYVLTDTNAAEINRRRTSGRSIAERIKDNLWPTGAQAHIGNTVRAGDIFPMLATKVWSPGMISGQVFLDGNDCLWVTSVTEGTSDGKWRWPEKV